MSGRYIWRRILCAACLGFSLALAGHAADDKTKSFVLGRISTTPESAYTSLRSMSQYLKAHMKGAENYRFSEVVVPKLADMVELLEKGEVDLLSETPFGALHLEEAGNAQILLHEWKKGVGEYSSMIITHTGTGIKTLADLRGRVIAFEDRGSSSGFLMPLALMAQHGLEAVELQDRHDTPPPNKVGYFFAGHEINIASLVARRLVDAGAISDLNWRDEAEVPQGFRDRLNVVMISTAMPRSTVLVRSGVSEETKAELKRLFADMENSSEGRAAMMAYHTVKKFEPADQAFRDRMAYLRGLYRLVAAQVP